MREMKFRAWIPRIEEMLFDVGIYPPSRMIGINADELSDIVNREEGRELDADKIIKWNDEGESETLISLLCAEEYYWFEEGQFLLMQYTGLKDKNGKEIYEGDIVKYGLPYHGEIKTICEGWIIYNEYCGSFQIKYENAFNGTAQDFCHRYTILEVIGNIHEDKLK